MAAISSPTSVTDICLAAKAAERGLGGTSSAVKDAALLAMDFHAHLCDHEVIGMLGGTFDAASRSMRYVWQDL